MKSVMRYVAQTSKTLWDGQQLVSGIGCQPETAFDEFLSTKLLHHKDGGVMFYHMVQSFLKGANIHPRPASKKRADPKNKTFAGYSRAVKFWSARTLTANTFTRTVSSTASILKPVKSTYGG